MISQNAFILGRIIQKRRKKEELEARNNLNKFIEEHPNYKSYDNVQMEYELIEGFEKFITSIFGLVNMHYIGKQKEASYLDTFNNVYFVVLGEYINFVSQYKDEDGELSEEALEDEVEEREDDFEVLTYGIMEGYTRIISSIETIDEDTIDIDLDIWSDELFDEGEEYVSGGFGTFIDRTDSFEETIKLIEEEVIE